MEIAITFEARTSLSQLQGEDLHNVQHALKNLQNKGFEYFEGKAKKLSGSLNNLWSYRAGNNVRIIMQIKNNTIIIIDIVLRKQLKSLNDIYKKGSRS